VAAAAAVLALVGCSSGGGPQTASAKQGNGPKTHLIALARHDLTLQADLVRKPNGFAVTSAGSLEIRPPLGSALLSFDVAQLDLNCAGTATLRVPLQHGDGVPVLAYVSSRTDAAGVADGTNLGPTVVASESPDQPSSVAGSNLSWDVLALLVWSRQHLPRATSFVVALRPQFPDTAAPPVVLGASESGEAGTLTVTDRAECSKPG
jgi:hypothetical protein